MFAPDLLKQLDGDFVKIFTTLSKNKATSLCPNINEYEECSLSPGKCTYPNCEKT